MKKTIFLSALLAIGMTFTNCGSDDDTITDTNAPTISIISPDFNQTFSTDQGSLLGAESVFLRAQGVDDIGVKTIKVTVTNSSGTVVFENTQNAPEQVNGFSTTFTFGELYETTNAGIYNAVFVVTDTSGNIGTSNPRTFTYED